MAYRINYTPEDTKRYPHPQSSRDIPWKKYCTLFLILVCTLYLKLCGIPDFLIPGDAEVTKQATQTMIADIKAGEPLDDAVTAFCIEIIHSAQ